MLHGADSFGGFCRLWYVERSGSKAAGTVVSVDSSIQPPSYAVRIDKTNSIRYLPVHL